jgi:hypothetical protein
MLEFALGFALGWVLFNRPAFVQSAIDWVKAKLGY